MTEIEPLREVAVFVFVVVVAVADVVVTKKEASC